MCLWSKSFFPKIATKDILCYKVLEEDNYGYCTPYEYKQVYPECITGDVYFKPNECFGIPTCQSYDNTWEIGKGFIHVYAATELGYAEFQALRLHDDRSDDEGVVFKCIIPKGTLYYIGDDKKSLAARKIKFIEKVFPLSKSK